MTGTEAVVSGTVVIFVSHMLPVYPELHVHCLLPVCGTHLPCAEQGSFFCEMYALKQSSKVSHRRPPNPAAHLHSTPVLETTLHVAPFKQKSLQAPSSWLLTAKARIEDNDEIGVDEERTGAKQDAKCAKIGKHAVGTLVNGGGARRDACVCATAF